MIRPSCGTGCAKDAFDLGARQSQIFFAKGLDDPNQIDPSGKIRFYVTVFFSRQPGGRSEIEKEIRADLPVGANRNHPVSQRNAWLMKAR
jgi:hypothetical protein